MGKKLNPEYRERMAERRTLARCPFCGKRNRYGAHAACERDARQVQFAADKGLPLIDAADLERLRFLRLKGEWHSWHMDEKLQALGLVVIEENGNSMFSSKWAKLSDLGRQYLQVVAKYNLPQAD